MDLAFKPMTRAIWNMMALASRQPCYYFVSRHEETRHLPLPNHNQSVNQLAHSDLLLSDAPTLRNLDRNQQEPSASAILRSAIAKRLYRKKATIAHSNQFSLTTLINLLIGFRTTGNSTIKSGCTVTVNRLWSVQTQHFSKDQFKHPTAGLTCSSEREL